MKNVIIACIMLINISLAFAQQDIKSLKYGSHKQQNLDLFLPAKYDAKTPVIIMLHGGAWTMGGKEYTDKTAKDLRNRGFVVANADYRYINDSVSGKDLIQDIDSAVNYLQTVEAEQYKFNNKEFHMAGISAGAHLALLYGYTSKREVKSVSALCAPSVLNNAAGLKMLSNRGLLHVVELLAGAKYSEPLSPEFSKVSPSANISNIPTLLFHGDKDDLVPYESSVLMYSKLQAAKVPAKFLTMKGKGHDCGMNQPDSEQQVLDEITNWVKKHN